MLLQCFLSILGNIKDIGSEFLSFKLDTETHRQYRGPKQIKGLGIPQTTRQITLPMGLKKSFGESSFCSFMYHHSFTLIFCCVEHQSQMSLKVGQM